MLSLVRRSSDHWVVCFEAESFIESCDADRAIAILYSFGVEFKEIEQAMLSLIQNPSHAVAEFGICGTFIYSRPARDLAMWAA